MPDLAARKIGMISQIISRSPPYLHIHSDREFIEFCPHRPKCNNMRKEDPQSVARVLTSKNISVWIPKIKINHDFTNQNSNIKHNTPDLSQESKSPFSISILQQQTLLKAFFGKTECFTLSISLTQNKVSNKKREEVSLKLKTKTFVA